MPQILVVEDSTEAFQLIRNSLQDRGYLTWATSIEQANRAIKRSPFNLILLDLTLPDGNGYSFCASLRTGEPHRETPVIFLTGKTDPSDLSMGFAVGGDDYVTKPFEAEELCARVTNQLRRRSESVSRRGRITSGGLEIEIASGRVWKSHSGPKREISITAIEFKILRYLMSRANETVSREDIFATVWAKGFHIYERSADTHISNLKKKLGIAAKQIESIHGCGYRFLSKQDPPSDSLYKNLFTPMLPDASFGKI